MERLIIYNFIQPNQLTGTLPIVISGKTGEQLHQWTVNIDLTNDKIEGSLIHRLTAKQFIKHLELNAKDNKEQIIQLATKWGLVSKYTTYIAIEERDNDDNSVASAGLEKININKQTKEGFKKNLLLQNQEVQRERSYKRKVLLESDSESGDDDYLPMADEESDEIVEKQKEKKDRCDEERKRTGATKKRKEKEPMQRRKRKTNDQSKSKKEKKSSKKSKKTSSRSKKTITNETDESLKLTRKNQISVINTPTISVSSQTRPLDIIVMHQNARGGFSLTAEFISAAALSNTLQELTDALPSILQNTLITEKEMIWATVIALVVFEITFKDLKDEWELLSEKSIKWLNSKLKGHNIDLNQLLEIGKKILTLKK